MPRAAILLVGGIIGALALIGDVKTVWSFSALTVLIYYAITNLAALQLPAAERLYPRWISLAGLAGCLGLTVFIPLHIWIAGAALLIAGFALRFVLQRANGAKND